MSSQDPVGANNGKSTAPTMDCRVYRRLSCEIPAKCHPASLLDMKEAGWGGIICDISQGGVRIRLQRRFERGTGLALELPGDGVCESSVVFVKVIHIKAQEDGTWALGCKFVSELGGDEVQRLLASERYVFSTRAEKDAAEAETDEA